MTGLSFTSYFPVWKVLVAGPYLLQGWVSHVQVGCSTWTAALPGPGFLGLIVVFWAEGEFRCRQEYLCPPVHQALYRTWFNTLCWCVMIVENCKVQVCCGIQGFPGKVFCCLHCQLYYPVSFAIPRAASSVFKVLFLTELDELWWCKLRVVVTDHPSGHP